MFLALRQGLLLATLALAAALPVHVVRAEPLDVVLSEVHYNPFGPTDDTREFVEVWNTGSDAVDIGGWRLAEAVEFSFPANTVLAPGERIAAAADRRALAALHPGARIVGDFDGRLENGGEIVALLDGDGHEISRVHYDDDAPWSEIPDGLGPSLELSRALDDVDRSQAWRPSRYFDGTPGADDAGGAEEFPYRGDRHRSVRIEEVAPGGAGFIELRNVSDGSIAVGGYQILNLAGQLIRLPSRTLAPGAYVAFGAGDLGFAPSAATTYVLLDSGGRLWLDALAVPELPAGRSAGRLDRDCEEAARGPRPCAGAFDAAHVLAPSRGAENRLQRDGRVVINEILFAARHEPASGDCDRDCGDRFQWIELYNRGSTALDVRGWRLSAGVELELPPGASIAAGGFVVLAASASSFRARYPGVGPVYGDWSGRLRHRAETIELRDATGNVVDLVSYGNGRPYNDLAAPAGDDRTFHGSEWPTDVANSDRSVELAHPELANRGGGAWRRGPARGTPAARNAALDPEAIVVWDVLHAPAVPREGEAVRVRCRAAAVGGLERVEVLHEVDGAAGAEALSMTHDGEVWTATLPGAPHGAVVAFRVRAVRTGGDDAVYPRPPGAGPEPSFLYEVDDRPRRSDAHPSYRIVMRGRDVARLRARDVFDDTLLPATFIGDDDEVYHNVGVRYRGENSRRNQRKSFRVRFPPGDAFLGKKELNLNTADGRGPINEYLAAATLRATGSPTMQAWPVDLYFRGVFAPDAMGRPVEPHYVRKENYDEDFLERHFGDAGDGNLYRALDPGGGGTGDLSFRGDDPSAYSRVYEKRSNEDAADFRDLVELTRAFAESPQRFEGELRRLLDVEQWAKFFATQALMTNVDGGIHSNNGEDYYLYHVPADARRADAGKWLILPWDIEETYADPGEQLFRPSVDAIERFLGHPAFAPLYLAELERQLAGAFSVSAQSRLARFAEEVRGDPVYSGTRGELLDFARSRRSAVLGDLVPRLEVGVAPPELSGREIIREGDEWAFFRGRREPSEGSLRWTTTGFDDASWERGASGFGYGDGDDRTVLADMQNGYISVYARREFSLAELDSITAMRLVVDYDDAFVAYLNGREIARSANLVGRSGRDVPLPFDLDLGNGADHEAARGDNGANPPDVHVIADWRTHARAGTNLLAVHGLNGSIDSSDFSLAPSLYAEESAAAGATLGWGDLLRVGDSGEARLSGWAPGSARSVRVGGADATIVSAPPVAGAPYGLRWTALVPAAPGLASVTIEAFSDRAGTGASVARREVGILAESRAPSVPAPLGNGETLWRQADGPYRIDGDFVVASGSTLRIEAGTEVYFGAAARLRVVDEGRLLVEGRADAPVRFSPASYGTSWRGVVLEAAPTAPQHLLSGLVIENVDGSAVTIDDARVTLTDSTLTGSVTGVQLQGVGALEARRVRFERLESGLAMNGGELFIESCVFREIAGGSAAVLLLNDGATRPRIIASTFERLAVPAIDVRRASPLITDSVFRDIDEAALRMGAAGRLGPLTLDRCLIHDCVFGVLLLLGTLEGSNDTAVSCRWGVAARGGEMRLDSSILWFLERAVEREDRALVEFSYSDVEGDAPWPGEGNLSVTPRFTDVRGGDFTLEQGSPCRGAGRDGVDMGYDVSAPAPEARFVRGDINLDGILGLTDVLFFLNYLFESGPALPCDDAADLDDGGRLDLTDALVLLNYLFLEGPVPRAPFPGAGFDPSDDDLGCVAAGR